MGLVRHPESRRRLRPAFDLEAVKPVPVLGEAQELYSGKEAKSVRRLAGLSWTVRGMVNMGERVE